jgi:hypothetical protein
MLALLLAKETWMQVIEAQQSFELRADFCFQKPAGLTQNFQVIERRCIICLRKIRNLTKRKKQ